MRTRFFSLLFVLVTSVGTMFAAIHIGDLYYDLDAENQVASVTSEISSPGGFAPTVNVYYGNATIIAIPPTCEYNNVTYTVNSIGDDAFAHCSALLSITIPNTVTNIGNGAFEFCSSLPAILIPTSVTKIGNDAFAYCTNLSAVVFPDNIIDVGDWIFANCTALTTPIYNSTVFARLPTSFSGAYEIPEGIEKIIGGACQMCEGLTAITIPSSVKNMGSSVFYKCSNLTSITWNAQHCSYGGEFEDMPKTITSFVFGENVKDIPQYLCSGMVNLSSIVIPNSVETIGESAFNSCKGLITVSIPENVISIGEWAFSFVPNITYNGTASGSPWGALSVDGYIEEPFVYSDASKNVLLACSNAATGNVVIPNGVTSIGEFAFWDCQNVETITIPKSVTSIGINAFDQCPSLTAIICEATTPPSIEGYYGYVPLYVPIESLSAYQNSNWGQTISSIIGLCSVTFKDWDGTILKSEQVEEGHAATAPADPTRDGYIFTGWDTDFSNVTANLVITAMYEEDTQGIKDVHSLDCSSSRKIFINNGQILILRGNHTYTLTGQEVK